MTAENVPQLLDDEVFNEYLEFIRAGQYDLVLDSLVAAAKWVDEHPYEDDPQDVSAGTILHIMVDSIKLMVGEVGTVGRGDQLPLDWGDDLREQRRQWQRWLHALETLAVAIGVDLGPFPQAIREEYVNPTDKGWKHGTTRRMLRMWKDSRPFMRDWLFFTKSQPQSSAQWEAHRVGLMEIMKFAYGLEVNWSKETRTKFQELWHEELATAEWNRADREREEEFERLMALDDARQNGELDDEQPAAQTDPAQLESILHQSAEDEEILKRPFIFLDDFRP